MNYSGDFTVRLSIRRLSEKGGEKKGSHWLMITCLGHILLADSLSERRARSLKVLVPANSINTIRA